MDTAAADVPAEQALQQAKALNMFKE